MFSSSEMISALFIVSLRIALAGSMSCKLVGQIRADAPQYPTAIEWINWSELMF
jgi:hypothetical protein